MLEQSKVKPASAGNESVTVTVLAGPVGELILQRTARSGMSMPWSSPVKIPDLRAVSVSSGSNGHELPMGTTRWWSFLISVA